jgi:hypothetical protein
MRKEDQKTIEKYLLERQMELVISQLLEVNPRRKLTCLEASAYYSMSVNEVRDLAKRLFPVARKNSRCIERKKFEAFISDRY